MGQRNNTYLTTLLLVLAGLSALRILILVMQPVDLSGDEAQYWEWSRHLDWCYYSKPPGVGFMIWLSRHLFGDTVLGVRFPAVALMAGSGIFMYLLGRRMFDARTGFLAALLLQITPLFATYGVGFTPDSPLLFCWTGSLYFLHRALTSDKIWPWFAVSVMMGLGLLSKYAIIYFVPACFLLLAVVRDYRHHLRRPWVYLSTLCGLLFFAPVILWNRANDWVTFRHDLGHTNIEEGAVFSIGSLLEFIGSQLGVVTPLLLVFMIIALIRLRKDKPLLFWFSIPILIGFILKSVQGEIQPNWAMMAYVTGMLAFAGYYLRDWGRVNVHIRRLVRAAWIIALVGTIFLYCPFIYPLFSIPYKWPIDAPLIGEVEIKDPWEKMRGWKELGTAVSEIAEDKDAPFFIFSDRYQITASLAFYVEGQPHTYCVNLGRRMNQWDLWPGFHDKIGQDAIYVSKKRIKPEVKAAFATYTPHPVTIYDSRGNEIRDYAVFICRDFQGMEKKSEPEKY